MMFKMTDDIGFGDKSNWLWCENGGRGTGY